MNSDNLAGLLIEGVLLERNNLTNYLSQEKYLLRPLHNLFFTRDASMGIHDKMIIARMASRVRERESMIMDSIFNFHTELKTTTINPLKPLRGKPAENNATIEGGDFHMVRHNVVVVGTGMRTSTQGIDFIIETLKSIENSTFHVIVQELPPKPESFI